MIISGGQRVDVADVGWVDACVDGLASAGLGGDADVDALRVTLDGGLRQALRIDESVIIAMVPNRQASRSEHAAAEMVNLELNERARPVEAKSS
jgi:hypothetical protein